MSQAPYAFALGELFPGLKVHNRQPAQSNVPAQYLVEHDNHRVRWMTEAQLQKALTFLQSTTSEAATVTAFDAGGGGVKIAADDLSVLLPDSLEKPAKKRGKK
jgi:hypothetical protein